MPVISKSEALVTKQGVRNLDSVGPTPKRGHVGRTVDQVQAACDHWWQFADVYDGDGLDPWPRVCGRCGKVRR